MHPLIQLKRVTPLFLIALACFGLSPATRAVSPPPDGGYPGGNTAEGQKALLSLTSGGYNTAVGLFGLVAEEVAEVSPDLVTHNANGELSTVRYEAVNAMLLNEFLKEHRKVEQQRKDFEAAIAYQQKQIDALTMSLQRVNTQLAAVSLSGGGLEVSKAAPETVLNNQ